MPGRMDPQEKTKREDFMLSIFRENPDLSVAKAQTQYRGRFKAMMRNKRAYELRAVAQAEKAHRHGAPNTVANRHEHVPTGAKVLLVEGDAARLALAREIVQALAGHGLPVKVDHATDAYLIVVAT